MVFTNLKVHSMKVCNLYHILACYNNQIILGLSLTLASRKGDTALLQPAHNQADDPQKPTGQQIDSINSVIFLALGSYLAPAT